MSLSAASNADFDVPELDVDPFDPDTIKSPYQMWERLRDLGPIAWLPKYGHYVVSRHAELRAVQENWQHFTTSAGAGMSDIRRPGSWRKAGPIVEVDPPNHTKVRKVLNGIVSPVIVRGWRERFESEAERMVEQVVAAGRFDGAQDVAEPYVLKVFPESIGMDIPREYATAVGDLNFNSLGPNNVLVAESRAKVAPILDWWHRSLEGATMQPGGFGEKLFQAEAAGELEPGTASGLTMSFLRGGMDTTISSIGSALWLLAKNPDQWRALQMDRTRLRQTFDETIRLESPIQTNFRTTTADVEFFGYQLKKDTKVQLLLGSANRDPRKWNAPDEFDVMRDTTGHVALGAGVHVCVGQMIARLEFDCVVKALLDRCESIELDGPVVHRLNNALRTLDRLPLKVTARA